MPAGDRKDDAVASRIEVTVPKNAHQYPTRCAHCYGGGILTSRKIGFDTSKVKDPPKDEEFILPEIPFCKRCATWQVRIIGFGAVLIGLGILGAFAIDIKLNLGSGRISEWIVTIVAVILCIPGYLVTQYRDKTFQISAYTNETLTFSFKHADYAAQFMKVNHIRPKPGQLPPA
jgi:hypothetical protein